MTGIFLSLKKDWALLQPPTSKGESVVLSDWMPVSDLINLAIDTLNKKHPETIGIAIDRFDARPSKGIAKVILEKKNWEVQIDCTSGEILSIAKRHADWIEHLHDGSIISDLFKLISMNFLGIGVIFMIISGTWLYYGPKRFRKNTRSRK